MGEPLKTGLFESQMLNSEAAAELWSLSVPQPLLAGHLFGLRKCSSTPGSWWIEWLALVGCLNSPMLVGSGNVMRPSYAKGF